MAAIEQDFWLTAAHEIAKRQWDAHEEGYWVSPRDRRDYDPSVTELDSDDADRGRELYSDVIQTLTDLRTVAPHLPVPVVLEVTDEAVDALAVEFGCDLDEARDALEKAAPFLRARFTPSHR
jgi:hypothetical protein